MRAFTGGPSRSRELAATVLLAAAVAAQDTAPSAIDPFEGKIVGAIEIYKRDPRTQALSPDTGDTASRIRSSLKLVVGQPFRAAVVQADERALWADYKIQIAVRVALREAGDLAVQIVILAEVRGYDRLEFKGLEHFTEAEVRTTLGYTGSTRVTSTLADHYARVLEQAYRNDGFYFARVEREEPLPDGPNLLTFRIDEGVKVTVRAVHFRGNESFPAAAPLGFFRNLLGSADVVSAPSGKILRGAPFVQETVEDDANRLRLFYRSNGWRDARVELVETTFTDDHSEVDLTFRIIEGPRYKISGVDIERVDAAGNPIAEPLYPKDELLAELQVEPGDYYDHFAVQRDVRALERYYGRRGHPPRDRYGSRALSNALIIDEPREVFDLEKSELRLIYRIQEGSPKKLRDVVVRGNTRTQDRVIRRRVYLFPGQILDMNEVDRSLEALSASDYFQDPETLRNVRFELQPVAEQPDLVDLVIDVTEGSTGTLLYGAGVSSNDGFMASIRFTKRNFDIWDLPSSPNPATVLGEIVRGEAFHGGDQTLDLLVQPGTEISTFLLSYFEPDIFRQHFETYGLRLRGARTLRALDGFHTDALTGIVDLQRTFGDHFQAGISVRQETTEVSNIAIDAPRLVFEDRGQTEIRSFGVTLRYRDLDAIRRPTRGIEAAMTTELAGGMFGAEEDFWKAALSFDGYWPFHRDSLDRPHVLHFRGSFDFGAAYGRSDHLFVGERFFMGGSRLRGFDRYGAGPTQFGRPVGGEAMLLAGTEYVFPLVSTRFENQLRETELLRGLVFVDYGQLGLEIDDPTFGEPRISLGVGLRIYVPLLELPIALDLGWPLRSEETDDRRAFNFWLGR